MSLGLILGIESTLFDEGLAAAAFLEDIKVPQSFQVDLCARAQALLEGLQSLPAEWATELAWEVLTAACGTTKELLKPQPAACPPEPSAKVGGVNAIC